MPNENTQKVCVCEESRKKIKELVCIIFYLRRAPCRFCVCYFPFFALKTLQKSLTIISTLFFFYLLSV